MVSGWNSDVVVMIWFSLLSRLPIFGFAPFLEGEPTKALVVAIVKYRFLLCVISWSDYGFRVELRYLLYFATVPSLQTTSPPLASPEAFLIHSCCTAGETPSP
jgi:hypothetical protein